MCVLQKCFFWYPKPKLASSHDLFCFYKHQRHTSGVTADSETPATCGYLVITISPPTHSTLVFKMDEAAVVREREAEERPSIDLTYFRDTWTGRLKIVELFCSLFAGALVPASVYKHASAFSFMSFVAWMTFINVLLDIVLHLVRIWEKLVFFTDYPEILFCLCSLGSFAFLIGSIAELAVATYSEHPGLARVSAIFGFVCMTVLAVECYFHYQSYLDRREERTERQEKANSEPAFTDVNNV